MDITKIEDQRKKVIKTKEEVVDFLLEQVFDTIKDGIIINQPETTILEEGDINDKIKKMKQLFNKSKDIENKLGKILSNLAINNNKKKEEILRLLQEPKL